MFIVSVWPVSQKINYLYSSIAVWGKFQSHRNNGINEKLRLSVARVVIFCHLHGLDVY